MAKKEKQFNLEGLEEIANDAKPTQEQQAAADAVLTEQQLEDVKREVELEQEFGDQDLRTFIEAGASSASFGLSDKILSDFGGEKMKEALRERRQRNEEAALAGEIAGIVAPTLASGGTSLVAKGAAAGVKSAAKAGQFVEKLTAKQLAKIAQNTGRKKIARDVIAKSVSKSAGSAVEGAFYGAGQLVSEDALGTAEFNAENLIASAGMGALFGGAVGGVLGSADAILPVVKNNKLVDVVSKKVNTNVDKRMAGAKLAKMTPGEITKLKSSQWGQQVYDNIPDYFKKNLKLKVTDDLDKLYNKSNAELTRLGDEIGDTALQIDRLAGSKDLLPNKSQIANKVQNGLKDLRKQFLNNPDEIAKKSLTKIDKRIAAWDEWLDDFSPIKATEIKELKTNLQQATKWNKAIDQIPLDGKMDRQVAEAVRQEFLDLADRVSTIDQNIGSKLRKLNLDYGTGLTVTNKLKRAVDKEASSELLKFKDLLVADILTDTAGGFGVATGAVVAKKFLESDLRRKLTLLTSIEKSNIKINKKISSGVKNFFSQAKKAAVPTSTKVLLKTQLSLPQEDGRTRRKPKTKQEAFTQIAKNLNKFTEDPKELINHLSQNALRTSQAAPSAALAMEATVSKAIAFLREKMPKDGSTGSSLFNRKWEPSSLELAKFERYLEAVENPISVVDDLESGTLTREAVEAVQEVYPDIYQRLQSEAISQISQNQDIPYEKRIQVGILLNLPSDASLLPENITALQQTFSDEQQQQTAAKKEEGAVKSTQRGVSSISFSEDAKSQTEKISTRE